MVQPEPPTKKAVKLRIDWLPVRIVEEPEDMNEHLTMAGLMFLFTGAAIAMGMLVAAIFTSFIAGAAVANAVNHRYVYGHGGAE
jgi:Kef-type K+ transport system membrane component KefB